MNEVIAKMAEGSKTPRYVALANLLRNQLVSGEMPNGGMFPTENELCAHYGLSRFTVREALRTLQQEGFIQRRRGSGTKVMPAAARGGALHQPLSNVDEILQYARDTRFAYDRLGTMPLPKPIAEIVGKQGRGRWRRFRGLRSAGGDAAPIAVTDVFIHPQLRDIADQVVPEEPTIFRQIEQLSGIRIARVTQDIQAIGAGGDVAAQLHIPRRSPCLRVLRCYIDEDDRIIEISVNYHPGTRFAYSMHIEVDR